MVEGLGEDLGWVTGVGDPPHQPTLHLLQSTDRPTGRENETLLHVSLGPQLLQLLVVKTFQKLPHCRRFGGLVAQAARQTVIPAQEVDVFGAFAPDDLKQGDNFEELGLGKPALALAQGETGGDQARHPQGAIGPGNAQQAGRGLVASCKGRGSKTKGCLKLATKTPLGRDVSPKRPCLGGNGRFGEASLPCVRAPHQARVQTHIGIGVGRAD